MTELFSESNYQHFYGPSSTVCPPKLTLVVFGHCFHDHSNFKAKVGTGWSNLMCHSHFPTSDQRRHGNVNVGNWTQNGFNSPCVRGNVTARLTSCRRPSRSQPVSWSWSVQRARGRPGRRLQSRPSEGPDDRATGQRRASCTGATGWAEICGLILTYDVFWWSPRQIHDPGTVNKIHILGALKTREWKTWHHVAGVENAGVENEGVECALDETYEASPASESSESPATAAAATDDCCEVCLAPGEGFALVSRGHADFWESCALRVADLDSCCPLCCAPMRVLS